MIIGATAAVIAGTQHKVYQASTSDVAPLPVPRAIELVGLFARRHWKDRHSGAKFVNLLRSRLEAVPAAKWRYNALSAPAVKGVAQTFTRIIDAAVPRWGAPRVAEIASGLKQKLADVEALAGRTDDAFQRSALIHDKLRVPRDHPARGSLDERGPNAWRCRGSLNIEWRALLALPCRLEELVFPSLD